MQKDMVPVLLEEGFNVNGRELMRIRSKYKWFLRRPNGTILGPSDLEEEQATIDGAAEGDVPLEQPAFEQDLEQLQQMSTQAPTEPGTLYLHPSLCYAA